MADDAEGALRGKRLTDKMPYLHQIWGGFPEQSRSLSLIRRFIPGLLWLDIKNPALGEEQGSLN